MPPIGPSYPLRNRSGSKQRAVNLIPVPVEAPGDGVSSSYKDAPGLVQFADLGAAIRGGYTLNGRAFVVAGSSLREVLSSGASSALHTLSSSSGWVDFAGNATQICLTDGVSLYVMDRASGVVSIPSGYPGGPRIDVLNEFLFMVDDTSGRVWWSDVGNATVIDALSFATAESAPDNLTACITSNEELYLIGRSTIEPWRVVGGEEVINKTGRVIEVGSESPYTVRRLDNSVFFLGSSEQYGQGIVYRLNGYTPQRISTRALEEQLSGLDLSQAYAYSFVFEGDAFYALQVPGLDTTWCFNLLSGLWFELAELVNGEFTKHRGNVHLFAFNRNLIGAADGKLYELDATVSAYGSDVLCRQRTLPTIQDGGRLLRHASIDVMCDTGSGGTLMVRWSDDGGNQWGDWEYVSLGEIGNYAGDVSLHGLGSAYRRVYEFRVTDAVAWNPSDVVVRVL